MRETSELPITGYLDNLSCRPNQCLRAHVSVRDGGPYRVKLVRVLSADPNPQGPGVRFEDLGMHLDKTLAGQRHPIRAGSYALAPAPSVRGDRACTWTALVRPGLLSPRQTVLSHEAQDRRLTLSLSRNEVLIEVATATGVARRALSCSIERNRWYRVWASADTIAQVLILGLQPLDALAGPAAVSRTSVPGLMLPDSGRCVIAARDVTEPHDHFDGRIEDPAVLEGAWESWTDPLIPLRQFGTALLAGWDFSQDISSQTIRDVGPARLHGELKNIPTRAVRGARWSGEELCWLRRPDEYGAIHFHSDDLGDCEWPLAFEFVVPSALPSGAYAFHLSCASGEDWLPFFITPPRTGSVARIAVLIPTFTYQAYVNPAFDNYDEAFRQRVKAWGAYPYHPQDYPLYGRSTYNLHPDGSGIALSSRLRPLLSMRPGFMTFHDAKGSGLHHYPADLHLLAWLEQRGFAFDVVTDEDLHEEGTALLAPYQVVLTGTHPEYQTRRTLDALRDYLRMGRNLAYLGGNGFYWKIGVNPALPGVIEIRRAEGGTRAWATDPGEYYHASDGAYGGLWCRNGRDPQALTGVGFSAQGLFEATAYRRTPESHAPTLAWMFDGVEGEILGDYGLSAGAAAGYELDRADATLGTPANAIVVAQAHPLPASFSSTPEDILFGSVTLNGEPPQRLLRGDMVYFETPAGGAVFSAGSITFCGSLWRDGFEGPISRLVENVVRRFIAPSR